MADSVDSPLWAVVPAAGSGARFGAEIPKQYRYLAGATVLEQTLRRLLTLPGLQQLAVPVSAGDEHYRALDVADDPRLRWVTGGACRARSVLAGLESLPAADEDWVLVHDAARPCCPRAAIERLRRQLAVHPTGGLLAMPINDTVKEVTPDGAVRGTLDRGRLWAAQTPQLFRYRALREALQEGLERGVVITDEASALEAAGAQPMVVTGSPVNIKITLPEDLTAAEYFLAHYDDWELD